MYIIYIYMCIISFLFQYMYEYVCVCVRVRVICIAFPFMYTHIHVYVMFALRTVDSAVDWSQHLCKVYAVDWSLDGARVATGSKDRLLKIWRH